MKREVMLSSWLFLDNIFGKLWAKLCEELNLVSINILLGFSNHIEYGNKIDLLP